MERKQREFEVGEFYDKDLAMKPLDVRRDNLEGLSYSKTNDTFTKLLSPEELIERRESLSNVCIDIDEIEERKKNAMEEFKEELKYPKVAKAELLIAIKHKAEVRTGDLFHIDDQENGFMYIFDENAECVESRPLKITERQTKIRTINKEANG